MENVFYQISLGFPELPGLLWAPWAPWVLVGSLGLLLAPPASSWFLLAPPGSPWLLLAPPGCPWLLLAKGL